MSNGNPLIKVTAGAQRALGLAEVVNKVFKTERVRSTAPGHEGYRLEMTAPKGPSTSEAAGAKDELRLIPVNPPPSATPGASAPILIASADPNLSQVEVHSYEALAARHGRHFVGEALPLDPADYAALKKKVEAFFYQQGITTVEVNPVASLAPPASGTKPPVLMIVAILVLVVLGLTLFFVRK
jgi:hypothetical protein